MYARDKIKLKAKTKTKKVTHKKIKSIKSSKSGVKKSAVLAPEQKHVSAENIVIEGDVLAGHFIESTGGSVTVHGKVSKGATVKSKYALTINGDAEEKSALIAQNGVITLKHACDGVSIQSPNLFVELESIGNNVTIETDDDVRVEKDIGSHCTIFSGRQVSAEKIGAHTIIKGKRGVTADVISEDTVISSDQGKVSARRVEERSIIVAQSDVNIKEFAAESAYLKAGKFGNVLVNGKRRANSSVAIVHYNAMSAELQSSEALKNLNLGVSSDKPTVISGDAKAASPSISEEASDSKIDPSRYHSEPLLTLVLPYMTAEQGITNINVHFYELLGQSGAILNIEANIPLDMQSNKAVLYATWGDVTKSIVLSDLPSVHDIHLYEEAFGNKTRIVKKIVSSDKEEPPVIKEIPVTKKDDETPSLVSSSQSLYLTQPSESYYSPSSPTMFSSRETKLEEKRVVPRPLKLPSASDLNRILDICGLVTEVEEVTSKYSHDAISISFDMSISTDLYEPILNKTLLVDMPGVKLTKCSVFTQLDIPDSLETYNQFMRNIEHALKQINRSETTKDNNDARERGLQILKKAGLLTNDTEGQANKDAIDEAGENAQSVAESLHALHLSGILTNDPKGQANRAAVVQAGKNSMYVQISLYMLHRDGIILNNDQRGQIIRAALVKAGENSGHIESALCHLHRKGMLTNDPEGDANVAAVIQGGKDATFISDGLIVLHEKDMLTEDTRNAVTKAGMNGWSVAKDIIEKARRLPFMFSP